MGDWHGSCLVFWSTGLWWEQRRWLFAKGMWWLRARAAGRHEARRVLAFIQETLLLFFFFLRAYARSEKARGWISFSFPSFDIALAPLLSPRPQAPAGLFFALCLCPEFQCALLAT